MNKPIAPSVIDFNSIQKLKNLQKPGRPDLLTTLIQLYFETAEVCFVQIRTAIEARDHKQLVSAAHSFKSSSANLGALQLAKLCGELEATDSAEICAAQLFEKFKELEAQYFLVTKALKGFSVAS